jgi:hypothetical protein
MKQQILGASADALDASSLQSLRQIARDLPSQTRLVHAKLAHTLAHYVRLYTATSGFDFG